MVPPDKTLLDQTLLLHCRRTSFTLCARSALPHQLAKPATIQSTQHKLTP